MSTVSKSIKLNYENTRQHAGTKPQRQLSDKQRGGTRVIHSRKVNMMQVRLIRVWPDSDSGGKRTRTESVKEKKQEIQGNTDKEI